MMTGNKTVFTISAMAILALAIGQVQAGSITVPNGTFHMYKPGTNYTVRGTAPTDIWVVGMGDNKTLSSSTPVPFDDGTSGLVVDIPGWITPIESQGSPTNTCDLFTLGYDETDGSSCSNSFGSWSGQNGTLAESADSLGLIAGGVTYTVSAMLIGNAAPVTFELRAGGVALTPSSSVTPVEPPNWQVISRTYEAADIVAYIGEPLTIVVGTSRPGAGDPPLTGSRGRFDNISLSYQVPSLPSQATNPNPSNGATNVWPDSNLSWTAGDGSTSSNVYFGTDPTPDSGESQGNQTGTTFEPGTMAENTTYYWRIDAVNTYGTTTGEVWSFTTGEFASGILASIMNDLADHIAGTTPLTGPEIEALTASFEANKTLLDDTTAIMAQAFDLVNYYDTTIGPLFMNAETSGGFPRDQGGNDGYELERAIFAIQQAILDVIFTPANCQIYQSFLDGKKFETAEFFPGACDPPADPQVSYNADINGTNPTMWGKPVCYGPIPARRPTGCYLAPGSIGEVTVPPAMVNQGFEILVGAHTVDKYAFYKGTLLRLDRVSKSFPITSTVTKIANPLGGGVYIMVPYEADLGVQTVQIKNVVKAPYYSSTSVRQTSLQDWTDTERLHPGPWADFESEKFMMTLPTSWIYNYADPVTQMQDWDLAMDGVSELLGFVPPHNVRNLPVLYVQPDRSIQHGAYGTGYPQINTIYNPYAPTNGNSNHFFLTDVLGWSTTYHELGHCQLFSKFPGHTESMVNLPYVYVATEKFGVDQVTAFTESMKLAYLENMSVDQAALTWFVTENFRNGNTMDITHTEHNEVRYQHRGYGRYVDMANLFGWNVLSDFYYQEHLDYMSGAPSDGLTDVDSRIFRLSKAAGVDLTPLIHCWGVHPKDPAALQQAIINEGLPSSPAIHARLIHYKDIIPADNAEFWDHYTTIYPSQPSGGNPNYQYGWYNVWKYIYDETHGTAAKAAMQDIIDLYFDPDTTPPTPNPMTWASVPAAASDSSITMTATVATDDLNDVEYYFTCTAGGGHDSSWQSDNTYTDTGLLTQTQYTYTVMARDTSNNHNQTAPSTAESATTDADTGAPTPNPATFASAPAAVSDTEIVMTATTGADGSVPVEYFFDEISGNPGGTDSGWTTNPVYNDTALNPDTWYTYTVQMRDALLNTGTVSAPVSTTTPLAGSITVNVPNGDFAMYKPGTDIRVVAPLASDIWVLTIGYDRPISGGGPVNFADGTTGDRVDIPGWITPVDLGNGDTNAADLFSLGYDETDGTSCMNAFGAWSGQNGVLAMSENDLALPDGGRTYVLSAMFHGDPLPYVLDLYLDGVKLVPDAATDPPHAGEWREIKRMYNAIGDGDLRIVVGTPRPGEPLTGLRLRIDNISLEYYVYRSDTDPPTPDPMTWALVPAPGGLASIITDIQENVSQTYFAGNVSNTDLIEGTMPSSSQGPWGEDFGGPEILTNGIHGGDSENAQIIWDMYDNDDSFVEYTLGTGDNGLGYNITSIRTFSAWHWADLHEQHYKVFLKKVGQPFAELTEVYFQPTIGSAGATQVTLTVEDPGILASGIEAIRFELLEITAVSPGGSSTGTTYREFDVQGVSTPIVPPAANSTSISMIATTATDISGVEYYFECTAGGGNDSGWQDSTSYTDTGLTPCTQYTYRVRAQDKSPAQNATGFSATAWATTTSDNPGDVTGECVVDAVDLFIMARDWLQSGSMADIYPPPPDGDGIVNLLDFSVLAKHWLEGVTP